MDAGFTNVRDAETCHEGTDANVCVNGRQRAERQAVNGDEINQQLQLQPS